MDILEVKNISKKFGGVQAVYDFSMTLQKGSLISIVGPNGAGKTTLFNIISGVHKPDSGRIILGGKDITAQKPNEITRAGIARTFQNIRLFKGLSVLENVMTAIDPYSKYGIFHSLFNTSYKRKIDNKVREQSLHYLETVDIAHLRNEKPENLPYGLQRKLELARALATDPEILMLDEPAAGLNTQEIKEFIKLIARLHEQGELSILLIEHRMQVVMELSYWIYVLNFGRKLADGRPEDIQNNPEVTRAYIGEEDDAC